MSDSAAIADRCGACQAPLGPRDPVFNQALGRTAAWHCLACLARAKGREPADLETYLLTYIARRACLSEQLKAATPPMPGWVPREPGLPAAAPGYDPDNLDHVNRYSRQLMLPQLGDEGQSRLARARILVVGAGGLGSPAALYLAAAGIGTIGLADPDHVELSNLQRQILHTTRDLGRSKTESATERLEALNPGTRIEPWGRIDAANAPDLVARYDVVVDGSDSVATRRVLNRACLTAGRPWVHAALVGFYGQATVFPAGGPPCYQCLFPEADSGEPVMDCQTAGVLGAIAGVMGSVQALEAIKLVLGLPSPLVGKLWTWDGLTMAVESIGYGADPACPACGASAR